MRAGASSFDDHTVFSCHYRDKYMKWRLQIALTMTTKVRRLIIFYLPFKKSIPYRKDLLDHLGIMYASLLLVVASLLRHRPTFRLPIKLHAQSLPFGDLIKAIGDGPPIVQFSGAGSN